MPPLMKRPATWTWCPDARAYYFAPDTARPPHYTTREVKAIIDIADDGTLAGVEIMEFEGPPLPAPPLSNGERQ